MYDIKIKCQKMVGQCPTCPIGRDVAAKIRKKVDQPFLGLVTFWHFVVLYTWQLGPQGNVNIADAHALLLGQYHVARFHPQHIQGR